MNAILEFNKAVEILNEKQYEKAAEIFLDLTEREPSLAPFCKYQLAYISNATGDPLTAYELYYAAFSEKPNLTETLCVDDHTSHDYVFKGKKEETIINTCPLCGNTELTPKWCYCLAEATGFNHSFNPVRLWMYCEPCHHIIAKEFPEKVFIYNDKPRKPDPTLFHYYSRILDRLSKYTEGHTVFEVGIGACECALAAREIGFDVTGIDVIDKHVKMAVEEFDLEAQTADILEYETDEEYDIIIMGDVIEHVSDPVLAIDKVYDMLAPGGAVWISTPNFDSAFSIVSGHDDPMRRQQYHLSYFSRESFFSLLDKCGLLPVDYNISEHYNGSMEIIAVRK